jgi:hypothetical protein
VLEQGRKSWCQESVRLAEEIRANAEAAIKRSCVLEESVHSLGIAEPMSLICSFEGRR